jgi:phage terminase small subunit
MNERQKKFCEFYAENPDGTDAAIKAGYSPKTAASIGSENLRKPELLNYIRKLQTEAAEIRIASIAEVKATWSDVLRDTEQKAADRIRAGELLVRSSGGFVSVKADEDGLAVSDTGGGAVIIMPSADGSRGDPSVEQYLTEDQKKTGWTVIR